MTQSPIRLCWSWRLILQHVRVVLPMNFSTFFTNNLFPLDNRHDKEIISQKLNQGPNAQRVKNAIRRVNRYPVDKIYQNVLYYSPNRDLTYRVALSILGTSQASLFYFLINCNHRKQFNRWQEQCNSHESILLFIFCDNTAPIESLITML